MCLGRGIHGFETDIRFTKDHKLVIMHDARVNRTTDGDGIIEEMTFDEVRKCRLKACSEPVPTLEEILTAIGGRDDIFANQKLEVPFVRVKITLSCTECKQRNYNTMKEKKNNPDRLEMKKYCRFCKKHTLHRETK